MTTIDENMGQDVEGVVKELYKVLIDEAYDLRVVVEGKIVVRFPNGAMSTMKIRKRAK